MLNNKYILTVLVLCAVLAMSASTLAPEGILAKPYPNSGDFFYDGNDYMDSYFKWEAPGDWSTNDPKYEHNVEVQERFLSSATSWSNIPDFYDDNATAGVLEAGQGIVYAFGSRHAKNVVQGQQYRGHWQCTRPSSNAINSSAYNLYWQELSTGIFGIESIWNYFAERGGSLKKGTLTYGVTHFDSYYYNPN